MDRRVNGGSSGGSATGSMGSIGGYSATTMDTMSIDSVSSVDTHDHGGLDVPSPCHRRQKSLDDMEFSTDHVQPQPVYNSSQQSKRNSRLKPNNNNNHNDIKNNNSKGHHRSSLSINSILMMNEKLHQALEMEELETQNWNKLANEYQRKLDLSLTEQSNLEQDLVAKNNHVTNLEHQVKQLKKSKHEIDSILSQEQMNNINEKQRWLDKENEYKHAIKELKSSIASLEHHPKSIIRSPSPTPSVHSTFSFKSNTQSTHNNSNNTNNNNANSKTIDRLKEELNVVKQQLELVSKEYALRHEKLKEETIQVKSLNNRLMEENEGFQLLLAQKTVLGAFSLADELEKNSEHVLEYEQDEDQTNDDDDEDKKRIYGLEFEVKSLQNYNKALKLSLERLVYRLLEFKDFEKIAQDCQETNPRSVSLFSSRVQNEINGSRRIVSNNVLEIPKHHDRRDSNKSVSPTSNHTNSIFHFNPPHSATGLGPRSINRMVRPASTWSSLIFKDSSSTSFSETRSIPSPVSTTSLSTMGSPSLSSSPMDSNRVIYDEDSIKFRRPSTHGQKKLKPLQLASEEEPQDQQHSQSLPTPGSATSWSFSFH